MPGPVVTMSSTFMCAHAGPATPASPFPRVLVANTPVVTVSTTYAVAGCALTGSSNPPCATAQWVAGATRVLAGGTPVALMSGTSLCTPTGTPMTPVAGQPRVVAS